MCCLFQGVLLNSSCLDRNLPHMFELWSDIFNRCVFKSAYCLLLSACGVKTSRSSSSPHLDDEERLRVLVMMSAQELANGISYSGHMYAMTRSGRHLTPAGDLQETFGGMDQVQIILLTTITANCVFCKSLELFYFFLKIFRHFVFFFVF